MRKTGKNRLLPLAYFVAATLIACGTLSTASAATAGIYGTGKFYTLAPTEVDGLRNSGMTTMFLFTLQIRANGDFYYNDTLVAQNGTYVGDPAWRSRLDSCRAQPSTIRRMEMCIGSWGSDSFQSIKDRIAADGTGSSTILYRNMVALKNALGFEVVQYDDEKTYDANSAVAFGNMLANMGLKVTLCPYHWGYRTFWQTVASQLGSKVEGIYLQCYDGGGGNNPADWNTLFGRKVMPGYWGRDGLATFTSKMQGWSSTGATGGFVWTDDLIGPVGTGQYAEAIHTGLGIANDTVYAVVNRKSGLALQPKGGGTANNTALHQWYYSGSNSFRWRNYNSGGQSRLIGVASGRAVNVDNLSQSNDAAVELYDYLGTTAQKVTYQYNGDGYYTVLFVHSGKAMTVFGASTAAGADIIQYTNNGGSNAQWQFLAP
jgi:hypothetical protein